MKLCPLQRRSWSISHGFILQKAICLWYKCRESHALSAYVPKNLQAIVIAQFFLFGARGTGKTRLLRSLFSDHESVLWIDLLREGEVLQFIRSANELRSRLDGLAKPPSFVVIDEVQRVPSLLNEVHSLIEERRGEPTWAIEIKSTPEVDSVQVRRLKELADAIPHSRPAIFCTTQQRKVIDGVLVMPWEQGIRELFH